jgi:L-2-hydroxyglutarate oxidase LhgO
MSAMKQDAIAEGISIHCGVRYRARVSTGIQTTDGLYQAGYVVNAAGLYADQIARQWGFSKDYRILPFKGIYLYSDETAGAIRTNIYPVPDLRNPFLGVHFTVTAAGRVKIGPTAMPAFWREQYNRGERFSSRECVEIVCRAVGMVIGGQSNLLKLAASEFRKYSRRRMVALAGELAEGVRPEHYRQWGKPGIRAQLVNIRTRQLEMDFVIQGDRNSMHVLNAVSPGFTCSIPFAEYVCERIHVSLN